MGLVSGPVDRRTLALTSVFVLGLLLTAAVPAAATVYDYLYSSDTGTVRSLPVTLATGTAGASSLSAVNSNAASGTLVAGLKFYETTGPTTACTTPTSDTSLTAPGTAAFATMSRGSTYCLWSTQYTASTLLYAGSWTTDLWLDAKKAGYGLAVTMVTTNSAGVTQSTIFSGTTSNAGTAEAEITNTYAGAQVTVPASGYVELEMTPPGGGGTPTSWDIYWGPGQLSNFQTPFMYDYVLSLANPGAASWSISVGVASSSGTSRLNNMTVFLKAPDTGPYSVYSHQVILGSSVTQQLTGTPVTWTAANVYVYVAATASSMGTTTVTLSVKLQPSSTTPYSLYTVVLTVN